MKNCNYILKGLLLLTIYCFGLCTSALTVHAPSVEIEHQTNKQQDTIVNATKVHFLHTQQSENLLAVVEYKPASDLKLAFKDYSKFTFSTDLQILASFKQYKSYYQTLRIRFRKSDLIFPFHNFW